MRLKKRNDRIGATQKTKEAVIAGCADVSFIASEKPTKKPFHTDALHNILRVSRTICNTFRAKLQKRIGFIRISDGVRHI
jgi:hypothetical protein